MSYINSFVAFYAEYAMISSNYFKMSGFSSRNVRYPRYQDTDLLQLCASIPQYNLSLVFVSGFSRFLNALMCPSFCKMFTTCSPCTNSAVKVASANSTCSLILNFDVFSFRFFSLQNFRNSTMYFFSSCKLSRRSRRHPCS